MNYVNHYNYPSEICEVGPLCNQDSGLIYKSYCRPNHCKRVITDVTCKKCLHTLAKRVGLDKGTPAEIIHDKFVEMGLA